MSHSPPPQARQPRVRPAQRQARLTMRRRFRSRIATLRPRLIAVHEPRVRLASAAILLACFALLYAFGAADLFYISNVSVEGQALVSADELVRAAGARNYNAFYLQFGEIERRVREVPGIRSAEAWYVFPNTVHVTVQERTPLLTWENGRQTAWVDESGAIFTVGKIPPGLPVVRDSEGKPRAQVDPQTVAGIRALFAALPSVRRVEYAGLRGVTFTDEHGWKILFGAPEQINAKLAMLSTLSAYLVAQKIEPEYVDVRLPERAFYKPK